MAQARHDRFSWLLLLCYRNSPTQAHQPRYRLLRFRIFLLGYMVLGLLSLINRTTLNQQLLSQLHEGCPSAGHLQTGHGNGAIPQVYVYVSVP